MFQLIDNIKIRRYMRPHKNMHGGIDQHTELMMTCVSRTSVSSSSVYRLVTVIKERSGQMEQYFSTGPFLDVIRPPGLPCNTLVKFWQRLPLISKCLDSFRQCVVRTSSRRTPALYRFIAEQLNIVQQVTKDAFVQQSQKCHGDAFRVHVSTPQTRHTSHSLPQMQDFSVGIFVTVRLVPHI